MESQEQTMVETNMDKFIKMIKKDQKKMYKDIREELNLPPPRRNRTNNYNQSMSQEISSPERKSISTSKLNIMTNRLPNMDL